MKTLEQSPEITTTPVQEPAPPPNMAAVNPFVCVLLRSPLHFVLSNTLLLLTFTGRKSGKRYTLPVAYSRIDDTVSVFTHPSQHSWWKNVRGGAQVIVEIKRRRFAGTAEAISDDRQAIAAALLAHLREHPSMARSYHVPLDAKRQPDPEAARQAAQFVVLVWIQLAPSAAR